MRLPSNSRGFTLLELLIVLLISTLALAAVGSRLSSGNPATRLQVVANDMASALRYARGQALLRQQPVSVIFTVASHRYQLSHPEKVYHIDPAIDWALVVADDSGLAADQRSIRFYGDGSSTGGRITLRLARQARQLDVNWVTGEVRLSDAAP